MFVIEIKCFDLVLEDEGKLFQLQFKEKGKGFIKTPLLGRIASFWLLSTFKDKALSSASSFIGHFEGEGKVLSVFQGHNNKWRYLMIFEFLGFGRRSTVVILEGRSSACWSHFKGGL